MPISDFCNREVVYAHPAMSIVEAAQLMREHHVGDLVVVEEDHGERVPVGIITDRDVVVEIVAKEVDPAAITVGDVMSPEVVAAEQNQGVMEIIAMMRRKGVRRLPVVNNRRGLEGIIAVDDLLGLIADELADLAKIPSREQAWEAMHRTV